MSKEYTERELFLKHLAVCDFEDAIKMFDELLDSRDSYKRSYHETSDYKKWMDSMMPPVAAAALASNALKKVNDIVEKS